MAKSRPSIPRSISEAVLKEYHHKCSICGRHNPQLHHLDEKPDNNVLLNLLPLCPNCHLQDIHNPTSPLDVGKLTLFRKYKTPAILDPRFHPIFTRMMFLYERESGSKFLNRFSRNLEELVDFIGQLKMGEFYRKKITDHFSKKFTNYALFMSDETGEKKEANDIKVDPQLAENARVYAIQQTEILIVEMLRYQDWALLGKNS